MPTGRKSDDSPKHLKQDRLVEQLIPDPGNYQPTIQLTGWLGKGTEEGVWRLYLTPQLDEFVQFSEEQVVQTQPVQQEQSPLDGTIIWLQSGTVLQHTRVVTRQVQADFLSGGITSGFMAGAVSSIPPALLRRQAVAGTLGYVCSVNPHIPACRPPTEGCYQSRAGCTVEPIACGTGAFCPSREFVCGNTVGCSVGIECSMGCAALP
jgi:hypothetical protein